MCQIFASGQDPGVQRKPGFVEGTSDERELLLRWLGWLRSSVVRNAEGLTDEQARWHPPGALIPLLGVITHLTHVEWRWIDGGFHGAVTTRSDDEFAPPPSVTLPSAVETYRKRAASTDAAVRALPLDTSCAVQDGADLRWVLLHLINETARHCGHADATRELLDGTVGE